MRRERQVSLVRRIALLRPRKHDASSQIPQLVAYCRETVLSGHPLQSALSQLHVAYVDSGTDERNTAESVGGCSKNLPDKATQAMLQLRRDIASES